MYRMTQMLCAMLALAGWFGEAHACKCKSTSFAKSRAWSTHIFEAKLTSLTKATKAPFRDTFVFSVTKVWKGDVNKIQTLFSPGHSCGLVTGAITQIGQSYLVYAKQSGGMLVSRQCRRVAPSNSATAQSDIKKLGAFKPPRAKGAKKQGAPTHKSQLRDLALACITKNRPMNLHGVFVISLTGAKPQMMTLASYGGHGWGMGAQRIDKQSISHKNGVIRFKTPARRNPKRGQSFQVYLKGQKSQQKGQPHHGQILIYQMGYPIPANVRMRPTKLICNSIPFPK